MGSYTKSAEFSNGSLITSKVGVENTSINLGLGIGGGSTSSSSHVIKASDVSSLIKKYF